jgi:hypothetical protein
LTKYITTSGETKIPLCITHHLVVMDDSCRQGRMRWQIQPPAQ